MGVKKENKFLVVKQEDIKKYLNSSELRDLENIVDTIAVNREMDGKKKNTYLVVNEDEPYAKIVWKLIEISQTNPEGFQILLENLEVKLRDLIGRINE